MTDKRREHPFGTSLALYAMGDVSWRERFTIGLHVFGCRHCRQVIEQSRAIRSGVESHQGVLPAEVDWQVLSREMKANIHLGFDAGAIVGALAQAPAPEAEPADERDEPAAWRAAVVLASVLMVFVSGWYLNRIQHSQPASASNPLSVQVRPDGLEVTERGGAMTLLTPVRATVRTDAEWGGGLRARYVDSETDQVTVSQVYTDAK
ncbi:MAG: hypothetical protein IT161_19325 [Bryobacterales bacterium]|nr:hypothetical protein [Bryobacterales bacterium]